MHETQNVKIILKCTTTIRLQFFSNFIMASCLEQVAHLSGVYVVVEISGYGTFPTNNSYCRKTRMINLTCGIKCEQKFLSFCHIIHAFERQTGRQTGRQTYCS